jgi:hypothetical protein
MKISLPKSSNLIAWIYVMRDDAEVIMIYTNKQRYDVSVLYWGGNDVI